MLNNNEVREFLADFDRLSLTRVLDRVIHMDKKIAAGEKDKTYHQLYCLANLWGQEKLLEYIKEMTALQDTLANRQPLAALPTSPVLLNILQPDDTVEALKGSSDMSFTKVDYVAEELGRAQENGDLRCAFSPPRFSASTSIATTTTFHTPNQNSTAAAPDSSLDKHNSSTQEGVTADANSPSDPPIDGPYGKQDALPIERLASGSITKPDPPSQASEATLAHHVKPQSEDNKKTQSSRNGTLSLGGMHASLNHKHSITSGFSRPTTAPKSRKHVRHTSPIHYPRRSTSPRRKRVQSSRVGVQKMRGDWQCKHCGWWWNHRFAPRCRRAERLSEGFILYGCPGTRKDNCGSVHEHGSWRPEPNTGDWYCGTCGDYMPPSGRYCSGCRRVRTDQETAEYLGNGMIKTKDGSIVAC